MSGSDYDARMVGFPCDRNRFGVVPVRSLRPLPTLLLAVAGLYNRSNVVHRISHGDRIAQGIFTPVFQANFIEVDEFTSQTVRGTGGFGSTGVSKVAA